MIQSLLSVGRTLAEYLTRMKLLCVLALSMRRSWPLWAITDPSTTSAETPGLTPASAPSSPGTGSTSAVGLCIRVSATEQRRLPTFPRMASPASGGARCPRRDTSTGRCFSRESWLTSWSTVRRRTFPNRCVYSVQFDKILLLSLLPTHDSDQ